MKTFNKYAVYLLIICILSSGAAVFADGGGKAEPIRSGEVLTALRLWDPEAVSNVVTRGEMTDIMVRLLGAEELLPDVQNEVFFDIPREHPLFKQIAFLNNLGIIGTDTYFRPDAPITYAETVKMLLCAMGYQRYAEEKGGYPAGYMRTAREFDLLPGGIQLSDGDSLDKTSAAAILENAVVCGLMEPVGFGDKFSYAFDRGSTLLSRCHGIYIKEGVLRNAGIRAMDGAKEVRGDQIMVEDKVIDAPNGTGAAAELLGYRVKAYYKDIGGGAELCFVQAYNNRVTEISCDASPSLEDSAIEYDDKSGKRRRLSFSDLTEFIYNDRGVYRIEKTMIENADRIELIDNGSEHKTLKIYSFEIAVVSGVDYSQNRIYFKYPMENGENFIYMGGDTTRAVSLKNAMAEDIEITAVSQNDILSILRDKEDKCITAAVSDETVSGVISRIQNDGGETYITVGEKEYRYSQNALAQEYYGKLKVGTGYILRLDPMGRIADVSPDHENAVRYGFLVNAAVRGVFEDNALLLMYLPEEGGLQEVDCADTVRIDGDALNSGKSVVDALMTNSLGGSAVKVMPKPVKYQRTADGRISMLNTPRDGANEEREAVDFVRYTAFTGGSYNTETHVFGGQVRVGSNTKIFCVPLQEEDYTDRTKYVIKDYNYLRGRVYPSASEKMEVFGMEKDMTAEVIVLYQENTGGTDIDQNTPITVVSNVMQTINKSGELICSIEGWEKGNQVTVQASSDFDLELTKRYNGPEGTVLESKVRVGDIIRYRTNAQGEITDYDKLFSLRDEDDPKYVLRGNEFDKIGMPEPHESLIAVSTGKHSGNGYKCNRIFSHNNENSYIFGAQMVGSFGKVKERTGDSLIVTGTLSNGKIFQEFCDTSKMTILTLDEAENKVYVSTVDEIKTIEDCGEAEASDVLFFSFSAKSSNLIIVKRAE